MPCAVSGRRYTTAAASATGPMNVLNMRLNRRGAVSVPLLPHTGHCAVGSPGVPLMRGSSARNRFLHCLQSTSGSVNPDTCPDASQTFGCMRIAASNPSMSSRSNHRAPPALLDVLLELDPERAVVPHRAETAIDLRRLKDEAASLGQRHELIHDVVSGGHRGPE